ncbi:class I SAM-dependent methyltransferase [Erythrobacter sp. HKB08]|uniref:class I SAM-dependent methyltransferase n=1 Tax=Erythrobacter sp. HKB08 TaxID=2502843 RepID=UPI001008B926|nr:class I SAM-dependent methyltransferase [Erythrobacter sp. HKB08]
MSRLLALGLLASCTLCSCDAIDSGRPGSAVEFPKPDRPISGLGATEFSTETARDNRGEAETVMTLAGISPGMSVADIGAGEGYYTVRLAERVGTEGRVLAQDIDREAIGRLGQRVERERFDNVSIKLGAPDDPRLPTDSFDRIFLVHMYHEVEEPYAFLWRLWPAVREDGQVIVVDVDRPTDQHGIDPLLLSCEFERVGFELMAFKNAPELAGYYAQFKRAATRPEPSEIEPCQGSSGGAGDAAP